MRSVYSSVPDDVSLLTGMFRAGQRVSPGVYRLIDGEREVRFEHEDILPATCDGRVGVYVRRPETWSERSFPQKEDA